MFYEEYINKPQVQWINGAYCLRLDRDGVRDGLEYFVSYASCWYADFFMFETWECVFSPDDSLFQRNEI